MRNYIIHLSDTDIRNDARILKEMRALEGFCAKTGLKICGMGLEEQDDRNSVQYLNHDLPFDVYVVKRRLSARMSSIKPLKHALCFFEIFFAAVFLCFRVRPKIIHCHDTLVLPIGLLIKFLFGAKLIYDAHELECNKNQQTRINARATRLIERLSWRFVDLLISVSPSINEWYLTNYGEKFNATVLNSPVYSPPVHNRISHLGIKTKLGIPIGEKVFVYLGIFSTGRGIEAALSAFADERIHAHLICIGWGPLSEVVEDFSLRYRNIHVHPPVEHAKVVGLIRECDFGLCMIENVSLSDYFCLPNKLFEYCFAGLPVLASDLPEISRVVIDHDIGLVCGPSEEEMINGISELCSRGSEFGFRNLDVLGWQSQAQCLVNVYDQLTTTSNEIF